MEILLRRDLNLSSFGSDGGNAPRADIHDSMTYLLTFGESGKNFIEIGKRLELRETMLGLAVP